MCRDSSDEVKTVASFSSDARPVVGSYIVTFLKPEMLHIYRQLTALRAWRPVVFSQKRENAAEFPFDEIVLLPKPRSHPLRRLWQKQILRGPITIYRGEARRTLNALHAAGARVLHVYFGHIGVHLLPLLERCDLPVVVSFHGADAQVDHERPAHLARTRRMLQLASLVLVRSESIGERLASIGCDRAKIRLHRTGLPLDDFRFHQHDAPADGAWRCVQACRLIPKKGLPTSLRAFAKFAAQHPHATFTIAGEGPQQEDLRSLARELGIDDRVFFTGFLPQEKLRALFAETHLFLHPSELGPGGDQEGVPNSMLEAMASGMPVVATRHGGIPEAVEHDATGLLVAEGDIEALAGSMLALASDPARYARIGAAAAQSVRERFDLARQARVLEGFYDQALTLGQR